MNAKRLTAYRVVTTLVLLVSALAGLSSPHSVGGDVGGVLPPLRTAQAASGTWTQTEWTTPNSTLGVAPSGTNQYFRPSSVSSFGQLVGTFGVCAGTGAWCQGPGDSAGGQTLRLTGNHKSDAGNPYSSDLNGDGLPELLFANTPLLNGLWIHWGQNALNGLTYSTAARTELPTNSVFGSMVADLNGDGLPELIVANAPSSGMSNYIYWGQTGPNGITYTVNARSELPTDESRELAVADLNRDGRPELIFANYKSNGSFNSSSYIYWGQAGLPYGVAYSVDARTAIPTLGAIGVAVADLNKDEIPELIFANRNSNSSHFINSYIYWGQIGGTYGVTYTVLNRDELPTIGATGVTVADLNTDNIPDIIFANFYSGSSSNLNSYVYWGTNGSPQYGVGNRTELPGIGSHRVTVAKVNSDNNLDVVIQNYDGGYTRIYWGPLPINGTATVSWTLPVSFGFRGLSLTDLNNDNRIDLVLSQQRLNNPTTWGISGRVYFHNGNDNAPYNNPPAFDFPVQASPSVYASFGVGLKRDANGGFSGQPRAVYGTAFPVYGVLESMVMDSGQAGTAWQSVAANTAITAGTGITLFVAASDNLSALSNPTWTQVGAMGNGSWTQSMSGVSGRYARYRVILWRDRTTEASPALQDITFNYETVPTQSGFNKSAPTNAATGQPMNSLALQWTTVGDATGYQICYDTNVNGACNASWQPVGNVASTFINGLTAGTNYEWQVRACNSAGCNGGANNGTWWTFRTLDPPGAFGKSAPTNGATGQPTNPTLSWGTASGTVNQYRYCVATTTGCTPGTSVGTATSVALSGLTAGTTYYWQVRACADAGCTVFTDANGSNGHWSFTVAAAPGAFSKTAPTNGATGQPTNPTLSWGTASGTVNHYRYCVATTTGCTPGTSVGTATSVALSGLTEIGRASCMERV